MDNAKAEFAHESGSRAPQGMGWTELWRKEDWWAIWLGLGIVFVAYALYANGSSLNWLAVVPVGKWHSLDQVAAHFAANWLRYVAQFAVWLVIFSVALTALGHQPGQFIPSFIFLYIFSVVIFVIGQWEHASFFNLEPPLVALLLGLFISNFIGLPHWMDAGFRVEFYIKTGIVLLGATLPFTLIMNAGPTAVMQASIVSIVTFLSIFIFARMVGLDRRFAATLGAGGAVCGVSGAIAISAAVGAKKEDTSVAITVVIIWAIIMIFFLPVVSKAMGLSTGVAGAWIGTSEFADAAGFAAAQAYGNFAGKVPGIAGTPEQAVNAFTLMKVIGRDIWIGIWAFVLAIISTTMWEKAETGRSANAGEIWWRFPKFVIGFLIASLFITWVTQGMSNADIKKLVAPTLIGPIKDMRTWAFIFCFFSIGLTTRFRELAHAGLKPVTAFSLGVVVNVVLGYVLSVIVFADHWANLK